MLKRLYSFSSLNEIFMGNFILRELDEEKKSVLGWGIVDPLNMHIV